MPSRKPRSATRMRSAGQMAADFFQYGATGQHQVGAFRTNARRRGALLVTHAQQITRHLPHLVATDPGAVDARAVIAAQVEVNAADGGHGSRGAKQMVRHGDAVSVRQSGGRQTAGPGHEHGSLMASKLACDTALPPKRSATVTTPAGIEVQSWMR